MIDMGDKSTRLSLATVSAVVVVALAGLVLDLGFRGAVPLGVVEVGEISPIKT